MAQYKKPFFEIYQTPRDKNTWRMVTKELAARAGALYRMVAYAAANDVYEAVVGDLPGGPDYKNYREGLKVEEVAAGKEGEESAFTVHAPLLGAKKVRKLDVDKTVIYVRMKRRLDPAAKDIQILEDNGPWTPDTIPFWPKKSEAVVIQRKVSKREADVISRARKPELVKVRHMLMNVGRKIKEPKIGEKGTVGRKGKAIPDIAMQAISLEFGESGRRSKPLWRRALVRLRSQGLRKLPRKYRDIDRAIHDPNSKRWKSWPPKGKKVSSSTAKEYEPFQKRLGY